VEDQMQNNSSGTTQIKQWVETYTEGLLYWALNKVSDKSLAEDLVQDTFLAAFLSFEKFKGDSEPKTWLVSILNNKIIDHYRKVARSPLHALTSVADDFFNEDGEWKAASAPRIWDMDSHLLDDPQFRQVLRDCMNKLPPAWRATMQLKYLQQKEGKEICQDLGISSSNFWQILSRSKLNLRACIEKKWFYSK
jgi:RNA polymerase sigma-70 factor (TIGR02943 family)